MTPFAECIIVLLRGYRLVRVSNLCLRNNALLFGGSLGVYCVDCMFDVTLY